MKTKLLIVSHPSVLDVNRTIYRELANLGSFEVMILAPTAWKGDLIKDLQCDPCEPHPNLKVIHAPIYFSGNGSLYFFKPGWKRKLTGFMPELIFLDEEPWSLSALQIYSSFPNVTKTFFTKQNLKKKLPPPFNWIQNWIFSKSSSAFSVASEVTEVLRWKNFKKVIFDLPHSYDPMLFKSQPTAITHALKQKLNIPLNKTVISYFGRLTSEKGIDDLLAAQHEILGDPAFKNSFFLWVGNGPLAQTVKYKIEPYSGEQTLLQPAFTHDQVGSALALSDILVLPSRTVKNWKEQFGRILVEAMACGSAVLGSDSGEIPQLIQRAGGGLVFEEKNIPDLVVKLKLMISNTALLNELKKNGHHYICANLTHATVAQKLAANLMKK